MAKNNYFRSNYRQHNFCEFWPIFAKICDTKSNTQRCVVVVMVLGCVVLVMVLVGYVYNSNRYSSGISTWVA